MPSAVSVGTRRHLMAGHADAPASTGVRAADSLLDHSAKAIEIEDIEARVAALEAAAPRR